MATSFDAKLRSASKSPPSAAYLQTMEDCSATSFPWDKTAGLNSACGGASVDANEDVGAAWLKVLERSFGTCARMTSVNGGATATGGGPVCQALDRLRGQRPLCLQTHATLRRAAAEKRRTERMRCPLGLLLIAVPVRKGVNDYGLFEFGPLAVERLVSTDFELGLSRLGFASALQANLQAPRDALRIVRAEDIEGVIALLERVAVLIAEEMRHAVARTEQHEPKAVGVARRYAELHIGDKIMLADVAHQVALSPDHFSRLFRRTAGVSFGEYVNCCRITNARRLLRESSRRVAEIAFACGFDSVPHFNRVFRRVTGASPTSYQRQNRIAKAGSAHAVTSRLQVED